MTFNPSLPIAETTADGKTRVRNFRKASFVECGMLYSAETYIENEDRWVKRSYDANGKWSCTGEPSGFDLRNVEPAPAVDWSKPVQFEDGQPLLYVGEIPEDLRGYTRFLYDPRDESAFRSKETGETSTGRRIQNAPPAPRTVQVEVAGVVKGQYSGFAYRYSPIGHIHIESEEFLSVDHAMEKCWTFGPWQTVNLELPE